MVGRPAPLPPESATGVHKVDEAAAGTQLRESRFARGDFQSAAEDPGIEIDHLLQVVNADHDVVDSHDIER